VRLADGEGEAVITLTRPFTPTTNNLFMNVGKFRVISKGYKAWREEAGAALKAQHPNKIFGQYVMILVLDAPDKRRRDCTNYIKAPEDLLVSHGVVADDFLAKRVSVEWSDLPPAKPGSVTVKLEAA